METEVSVDDLAQIIRRVDGENKLGAGALAEAILASLPISSRQIIHELAADIRDRMSWEEGSAIWRNAQRIVELSRPACSQPEAYGVRVTDEMVERACPAICAGTSFGIGWDDVLWLIRTEGDPNKRLIAEQKRDRMREIARAALEAALSHTEQGETP